MKIFLLTLAFTLVIAAIAMALLLIYAATHRGKVGQHVSANPALRREGVGCVQSQDRQARRRESLKQ